MTHFDVENVTRIAQEAAREVSPSISVAGVVLGAGGSDYVEILVNLEGCRAKRQCLAGHDSGQVSDQHRFCVKPRWTPKSGN